MTDYEKLKSWIIDSEPQLVFHFAAKSQSYRERKTIPGTPSNTNLMGTVNLLEAVRQANFNCDVIIATTDKVYKNDETGKAFRESDVLGVDLNHIRLVKSVPNSRFKPTKILFRKN